MAAVVCKRVLQESVTESQAELMIHDELVERLGADSVPRDLRVRVVQALFNEAASRNQRGDSEGAIEGYDEVIRRFRDRRSSRARGEGSSSPERIGRQGNHARTVRRTESGD